MLRNSIGTETSPALGSGGWVLAIALIGVVMLSPLNRGSFFLGAVLEETVGIGLLIAVSALMVGWGRVEIPWRSGILIGAAGTAIAYGIAMWGAIHPSSAVLSLLLRIDYLGVALAGILVAMRRYGAEVLSWLLVAAGWLVGGYGLLAEAGYVHYTDAIYGGRLSSFFQYPNATAAYLLLAMFTALGLALRGRAQGSLRASLIGLALAGGLFPAFLLAKSRATWLLLPFLILLFIGAMPRGQRARSALYTFSAMLGSSSGLVLFIYGTHNHNGILAILGEILGAAVAAALGILSEGILASEKRGRWMGLGAGVVLVGILGYAGVAILRPLALHGGQTFSAPAAVLPGSGPMRVRVTASGSAGGQVSVYGMTQSGSKHLLGTVPLTGGVVQPDSQTVSLLVTLKGPSSGATTFQQVLLSSGGRSETVNWTWSKLIPQSLYLRLININPDQLSVWERFIYWHDAIAIWLQRPLTGWGGGGWAALYHQYQSFGYTSNQAHSALLQTADGAGIIGVVGYLWMWGGMLVAWWRLRNRTPEVAVWAGGLGTGLLAIGLHSLMDFDLSLVAVALAMMTGLGIMAGLEARETSRFGAEAPEFAGRNVVFGGSAVAGLGLSVYAGILLSGHQAATAGMAAVNAHNYSAALADFQVAAKREPLSSQNHLMLGQLLAMEGQLQKNTTLSQGAFPQMLQAAQLDPSNPSTLNMVAQAYFQSGQVVPGVATLEQVLRYNPWAPLSWENLAQVEGQMMNYDLAHKDPAGAMNALRYLLAMPARIGAKEAAIPSVVPQSMRMSPWPPAVALWVGAGDIVAGRSAQGMTLVAQAQGTSNLQAQSLAWQVVGDNAAGNKGAATAALKNLVALGQSSLGSLTVANQVYGGMQPLVAKAKL